MNNVVETVEKEYVTGKIVWDYECDSEMYNPRSYADFGTMFCGHPEYVLGDEQLVRGEDLRHRILNTFLMEFKCENCGKQISMNDWHEYYHSEDEDESFEGDHGRFNCGDKPIVPDMSDVIIMPLYLYDHSGITMRTSTFFEDPGGWDTSDVGVIAVPLKKALEWMPGDSDEERIERAKITLQAEVNVYAEYLEGNFYGYVIENKEGDPLDGCWGYLGYENAFDALNEVIEVENQEEKLRVLNAEQSLQPEYTDDKRFIVIMNDDNFFLADEKEVSHMFDMVDCDSMEGVQGIYVVKDGRLYRVSTADYRHNPSFPEDQSTAIHGYSDLVITYRGHKVVVGQVKWSDH